MESVFLVYVFEISNSNINYLSNWERIIRFKRGSCGKNNQKVNQQIFKMY